MDKHKIDLILPIKHKWLKMIVNNIKLEEYRENKPYWNNRIKNIWSKKHRPKPLILNILLRNGYATDSPYAIVKCEWTMKTGKPEWGAEPNVVYNTFCILEILEQKGI